MESNDVNHAYIKQGQLTYDLLEGWWTDAGTFDSLDHDWRLVSEGGANKLDGPAPVGSAGRSEVH